MLRPVVVDRVVLTVRVFFRKRFNSCPECKLFFSFLPQRHSDFNFASHRVNTIFVPTMASRLMLSLKRAAAEPYAPWSLSTMTDFGRGTTPELRTIHFAPRTLNGRQEISESLVPQNERDVELQSMGVRDRWN